MPRPTPSAAIFDVDGTLVDSNDAHAAAWADALRDFEIDRAPSVIRPLIGMGADKLLPQLTGISADSERGKQIVARRSERFRDHYIDHLSAFPGARELLQKLTHEGIRLGIASSAQEDELERLLDIAGLRDLLPRRTSADDVEASKPDPDVVHAALTRLGVDAGAAVMVGDTGYDIQAANNAGVAPIAFRCGGWSDLSLEGAVAIFDGPAAMLAAYEARGWDFLDAAAPAPSVGGSSARTR